MKAVFEAFGRKPKGPKAPGLIVLADALWREAAPNALHVLTAELAERHPTLWIEAPLKDCLKAPGLYGRLRRSLRLDLPAVRYVDGRRELDVATPPLVPPGNPVGDALLTQTASWILRARHASPRVLWLARRGPAADALALKLAPDVTVDYHDDPAPGDRWCAHADLILWPAWAPVPEGESEADPRLMRLKAMGTQAMMGLVPMVEGWLAPTMRVGSDGRALGDLSGAGDLEKEILS